MKRTITTISIGVLVTAAAATSSTASAQTTAEEAAASEITDPQTRSEAEVSAAPTPPASESAFAPANAPSETGTQSEPASDVPAPQTEASSTDTAPSPAATATEELLPPPLPTKPPRVATIKRMKHMFNLMWNTGVALGDSFDYVETFSTFGFSFDYRYRIIPHLSVGALIGWNNVFDSVTNTSSKDNITVTRLENRWLGIVPFLAATHAYLPNRSLVLPFPGMNLGSYYTSRITDNGWWTDTVEGWHFGLAPELGVYFPGGPLALNLNIKYHYILKTSDAPKEMFFGINFGVAFVIG